MNFTMFPDQISPNVPPPPLPRQTSTPKPALLREGVSAESELITIDQLSQCADYIRCMLTKISEMERALHEDMATVPKTDVLRLGRKFQRDLQHLLCPASLINQPSLSSTKHEPIQQLHTLVLSLPSEDSLPPQRQMSKKFHSRISSSSMKNLIRQDAPDAPAAHNRKGSHNVGDSLHGQASAPGEALSHPSTSPSGSTAPESQDLSAPIDQVTHEQPAFPCPYTDCKREDDGSRPVFYRKDLLEQHKLRNHHAVASQSGFKQFRYSLTKIPRSGTFKRPQAAAEISDDEPAQGDASAGTSNTPPGAPVVPGQRYCSYGNMMASDAAADLDREEWQSSRPTASNASFFADWPSTEPSISNEMSHMDSIDKDDETSDYSLTPCNSVSEKKKSSLGSSAKCIAVAQPEIPRSSTSPMPSVRKRKAWEGLEQQPAKRRELEDEDGEGSGESQEAVVLPTNEVRKHMSGSEDIVSELLMRWTFP